MSGWVYLIGPKEWTLNRVKIGFTQGNPRARLRQLQTGSPFDLQLYGYFEGTTDLERVLHKAFQPVREQGEWFRTDGRMICFISLLFGATYGERPWSTAELIEGLLDVAADQPLTTIHDPAEWLATCHPEPLITYSKSLSKKVRP